MGGLNTMALSRDQQVILTAGQEKRITYANLSPSETLVFFLSRFFFFFLLLLLSCHSRLLL